MTLKLAGSGWHEFRPGVRVEINEIDRQAMRRIAADCGGDDAKFEMALADAMIKGWEGISDDQGQPLPLTPEHKLAVRNNVLIGQWIEDRAFGRIDREDAEIKN